MIFYHCFYILYLVFPTMLKILNQNTQHLTANARWSRRERGGSNAGSLPRDIRTSQPTVPSPSAAADSSQGRTGSPAPPPTSDRSAVVGAGSLAPDHTRPHGGGSRRASGSNSNAAASRFKTNGILRPKAGTLPLPSRRRVTNSAGRENSDSSGSGGGGGAGGRGGDSDRWANPAPRGRPGPGHGGLGSSGTSGYPGSIENRGGGGGGSVSSRTSKNSADAQTHLSHTSGPPRSYDYSGSSGQQRSSQRAGGAPVYRSGSPAPVRSRRPSTNAAASAAVAAADSSRFLYQQRTRGLDNKQQSFGIPPSFRGYMVSSGGGRSSGGNADSSVRGTTARRSYVSSPTARDRGRRASSGSDGVGRYDPAKKPGSTSSAATDRSPGQRPSTSEGLTGGSSAGRRGRSASPAPRPSSGKALHCVPWTAC